jgi:hypothetical protein
MAGLPTKGGGIGSAANPFSRQGTLVRVSKSALRSSWAQRKACSGSGQRDKQFRCSRKINLSISVLVLSCARIQFAIAEASLSVGPRTKVQASIAFTLPIISDSFVFECPPHKDSQCRQNSYLQLQFVCVAVLHLDLRPLLKPVQQVVQPRDKQSPVTQIQSLHRGTQPASIMSLLQVVQIWS